MWRALALFVVLLLAVGTYAALAGDPPEAPPERPASAADGPGSTSLGFALAAGAVAMAATLMVSRPRRRFR